MAVGTGSSIKPIMLLGMHPRAWTASTPDAGSDECIQEDYGSLVCASKQRSKLQCHKNTSVKTT